MGETWAVERIADAQPGDTIWVFDSQQIRYENGTYKGRGVWRLLTVKSVNRRSLTTHSGVKLDRKTGAQLDTRGYSGTYRGYGNTEKCDKEWRDQHGHRIMRRVETHATTDQLRQIFRLLGMDGE